MKFTKISKINPFQDYFGIKAIKDRLDKVEYKLQHDVSAGDEKTFSKAGNCLINIKDELLKLERLLGINK